MKKYKISVIIPYFNTNKDFFNVCISSILLQSYSDFELLIIDDGSKKEFKSYLDEIAKTDNRIRVYHNENQGVAEARNFGLEKAQGEAICFVDSDDYVAPWMLEDLWSAYSQRAVEAAASRYRMVLGDDYEFEQNKEVYTIDSSEMLKTTLVGMNCNPNTHGYLSAGPVAVLFNARIAKSILFPPKIKYMEDVIWNYKFFSKSKKIAIVEECVYAYRQNASSATHSYKLEMIDDRIMTLSLIKKLCGVENEWYALRVLANYSICCKCCMLTSELSGFGKKISRARAMNKDPVWQAYKATGIAKQWDRKYKIKRFIARTGLMPFFYMIHK